MRSKDKCRHITVDGNVNLSLGENPRAGKNGMVISRVFTKPGIYAYDTCKWVRKDITMWAGDKIIFQRKQVEVPAHWGDKAVQITASKYLYGSVPGDAEYEDSFKHLFDRIVNTYTIWGWRLGYFKTQDDAIAYNQELKYMLVHQMWAPNSPVWFNIGLREQHLWGRPKLSVNSRSYAVGDPAHPEKGVKVVDNPQTSACFILGVGDSMDAILKHQYTEGTIFASGSGIGINISSLRSAGEPISGKGTASGPLGFNAGWDKMASAIKSGGKTRRAARMVVLYSDHPDIFQFVTTKFKQEEIAKVILREHNVTVGLRKLAEEKLQSGTVAEKIAATQLLEMPLTNEHVYLGGMDDLVYGQTLSHQNANHTVSLKAGFWLAYKNGEEYATRWVRDPNHIASKYKPRELLEKMAESIWGAGEPGVHHHDIINFWNPFRDAIEIEGSNPCSEYLGPTFSACNLSSFNLIRFYNAERKVFDHQKLKHGIRLAMIAADLNITNGGFPIPQIAETTAKWRSTGIGFANLGGLLMASGIPYDSQEGRAIAAICASYLSAYSYATSVELAQTLGVYPGYAETKESLARVQSLQTYMAAYLFHEVSNGNTDVRLSDYMGTFPKEPSYSWNDAFAAFESCVKLDKGVPETWGTVAADALLAWEAVKGKPVRNAFVTCIAPTGTISAPMGIYEEGTTSAEPEYSLVKYKALAGGGSMILINGLIPQGLAAVGCDENTILRTVADVAGLAGLVQYIGDYKSEYLLGLRDILKDGGPCARAIAEKLSKIGSAEDCNAWYADLCARAAKGSLDADELNLYTGQKHLEGLGFSDDVLRVFDCAIKPWGASRAIAVDGHLKMLGALQPFLSGATSKTVNMPADATKEDIYNAIVRSHEYGIKCIAIYRDTSRAQEVYSTANGDSRVLETWGKLTAAAQKTLDENCSAPTRKKLSFRRPAETIKFKLGGIDGYLTVGTYDDGTCAEIFGRLGQGGSIAYGMFDSFCKSFSIGLQYGIPLESFIEQFRYLAFDPSGFVQIGDANNNNGREDPNIHYCKSIIDLLMQLLEWLFPKENARRLRPLFPEQVKISEKLVVEPDKPKAATSAQLASAQICPKCGSLEYMFDGHCRSCRNCGFKDGGCGA